MDKKLLFEVMKMAMQNINELEEEKKGPGRPRTIDREYTKSSQEGLQENWTRATFIVREDLLEKLKDLAYTNRTTIKDEINQALAEYLKDKEVIRKRRSR